MRSRILITFILLALCLSAARGEWEILGPEWRPDANPWTKQQVWDGYIWSEGWSEVEQFYPKFVKPAGSIHLILRNDATQSYIQLTHIDDVPIGDAVTKPDSVGRVVWYRMESPQAAVSDTSVTLPPGAWVQLDIRLREVPRKPVKLMFSEGAAGGFEFSVPIRPPIDRIESVSFSPGIDRMYIYIRALDGRNTSGKGGVSLDGKQVTSEWTPGPPPGDLILAEVKLDPKWEHGTHHLVDVLTPRGESLAQPVRAWDGYFTIGLYGVTEDARVKAAREHGFNTYFTGGLSPVLTQNGMNTVPMSGVGEGLRRTPQTPGILFYNNTDEPDAHDFHRGEALPVMQRLGVNAMQKVLPIIREQRAKDPQTLNLLVLDNTYKPMNWYVYGQIPDVLVTDPYVPLNGRQLDYVYHALDCARDASTPRPMIPILWACSLDGARKLGNRAPTPEEERIMAAYALGCGAKGLVYFIDMSATTGEGTFTGLSDIKPLFEEVGRINKDAAALAPYLSKGCPIAGDQSDDKVWVRSLMCGPNDMVVVVVNKGHHIGFETKYEHAWHFPAKGVEVSVPLPPSFEACEFREVKDGVLKPVLGSIKSGKAHLRLGTVDTARIFVISRKGK